MKKRYQAGFTCLVVLMMTPWVLAHNTPHHRADEVALRTSIPSAALEAVRRSQGWVEVRLTRLDGTVTYQRESGFLVDTKTGFVVTSIHLLPDFRAVVEDADAVTFYKVYDDDTVTKVHAYVYATSQEHELAILQLDGQVPEGMEEVMFADEIAVDNSVYAHIDRSFSPRPEPLPAGRANTTSFHGRIVKVSPASDMPLDDPLQIEPYVAVDPPVEFFGDMVVDASGRVVGMGNGIKHGHAALTSPRVIQNTLAEAQQAEQKIVARGGATPRDTHTIKQLAEVFEDIMLFYTTQALERPRDLRDCAYEMFAMQFSGACRDTFSSYLPPRRARQKVRWFEGNYGGIGLKIIMREGRVEVVTPFTDTPAARIGIKPGDTLKVVDGKEVRSVAEALERLHGPPGTKVTVTVWRQDDGGKPQQLQFTVVRDIMTMKTVMTRVATKASQALVGIVTIGQFRENTAEQFQRALDHFLIRDIDHIVVDVRNNPGGSLHAAVRMLALFMRPDDTVLMLRGKQVEQRLNVEVLTTEYGIQEFGTFRKLKLIVLINGGSASAAEIVAGTLQDWGYPVVGEPSFGKGVAQSPMTLRDDSMLIGTTFEFLVGNHLAPIRDRGVLPNIVVENLHPSEDEQLDKAIEVLLAADKQKVARN
jgi:carboxyl-terminal processing protease